MASLLSVTLVGVFVLLALVHVYWAFGGQGVKIAAVPEVEGRPAFVPSRLGTLGVALSLLACALLVAAASGIVLTPLPGRVLCGLMFALAFVFLARAVGDFRLVGFFKKITGTRFARLDSAIFSPLCLAMAVGIFVVEFTHCL
uniref:DUF3995 domain-containing protein n=1 Tax=mine drainage metagenome TaxID=410659 RepID=E6QPQ9_9ZZZZ